MNIIEMASIGELTPGNKSLVLSDGEPVTRAEVYDVNRISYSRNLTAGDYATFCVPFDVRMSAYSDDFVSVYTPMNIALLKNDGMLMLRKMTWTDVIPAGTPFIAKAATTGAVTLRNASVTSLTDNMGNPEPMTISVLDFDGNSSVMYQNGDITVKMGGTYNFTSGLDDTRYRAFFTDGSFGPAEWLNPFRMYVYKDDSSSSAKINSIMLGFDEEETTGIMTRLVDLHTADAPAFSITGQRINASSPRKGIIIKNNKKYVVR